MVPDDLRQRLHQHGQQHLLDVLAGASRAERESLLAELTRIDLAEIESLYARRHQRDALPTRDRVAPLPRPDPADLASADQRQLGARAVARGEVAFLVVAGGQGTRLGFDKPKGMFPIGPVSGKSLFQLFAEKILALRRLYNARLPLLVMTSPATDAQTRVYFEQCDYFHLPQQDVLFFCQGTMPAVDLASGRLLLESPGNLCLSPNGHGGTVTGLHASGLLDRLADLGIHTIYYFQVDNPLVNLADFAFLGSHLRRRAEFSAKVILKSSPMEKVGNFLLVDGRCSMIEYSDLPKEWAHETDPTGELLFWAGNPAIHLLDVDFLRRMAAHAASLPWHLARKAVPHWDASGRLVAPAEENALKFERFIFDLLPQAERWAVHPTTREEEFGPVKNKEGVDSPATARAMLTAQATRWLRQAGVDVAEGVQVEISPLAALDPTHVREQAHRLPLIRKNTYIREEWIVQAD